MSRNPDSRGMSLAADRLLAAIGRLADSLEAKQNFNPRQPRRPRGTPIGGQWTIDPSISGAPTPTELGRMMQDGAARTQAFLLKHRNEIIRILGGVQVLGGSAEFVAGASLGVVGLGTTELGVGIPVSLLAGWMVTNGYDNAHAGWRALVTGNPQETNLNQALRSLGLSETAANSVEILLSGGAGVVGAKLSRSALDRAAFAALERRALRAFDPRLALDIRANGRSIWEEVDIRRRGEIWERFDVQRTGYRWFSNARAFDQVSPDETIAVSNKTLDMLRETYLRTDKRALYSTLKKYIDEAANFTPISPRLLAPMLLRRREIHLLLRFGDAVPAQALQIAAAEEYAIRRGVRLKVEYAR